MRLNDVCSSRDLGSNWGRSSVVKPKPPSLIRP
jgi:hypothetical protein